MPNVVVYVPAAAWRRLQERGLDPAAAVREFARRGYEFSDGPAPHLAAIQPAGTELSERGDKAHREEQPRSGPVARAAPATPRSESSGCRIDTPKGTKCKVCGKVH